ncbi:protoheme IX farnesyltransferase, mitochondrial [Eucalyptus grandis]|uniref:protoheme IX farnesyltransferase, mitochondrial n=1 Tax=Eucalyptus grandis TaxID=71139 RepID=UPI00192EDAEC|nr:protoheme IX farnesyltransferase, mitochondrial [Eucalyptus grandis]
MWRSSLGFSSARRLLSSSPSPSPSTHHSSFYCVATRRPLQSLSGSPSSPSAAAPPPSHPNSSVPANSGVGFIGGADGVRAFASSSSSPATVTAAAAAAAFDVSSLASLRAREAVDVARHYGRCYWELSKARLSLLVVATSGTGFVLGSGSVVDIPGLCWTCGGTMMVAAAANSLNQVFEIKNDAKMKRTKQRPLPSGRISVPHAVAWASSAGVVGTALLAYKTNALAAGFAASNLILYAFVYTPLKQIHPVNTWVGAIVGAIPPLLGWVAASGEISLNSMILPAALYFWQIPHFMALAHLCRNDYAAGGFKMLSLGDALGQRTSLVALRNCLYMVPLGYLAYDWGLATGWFCLESTVLTLAISATAFSFYRDRTMQKARRMFHASLLYLPVFMSGLIFHRLLDSHQDLSRSHSLKYNELSSSLETPLEENGSSKRKKGFRTQAQPPVAYASYAPFPFLPAPSYAGPH